jgi:hypothetical protein
MPLLDMLRMSFHIGARFVENIIELEIQVMRLKVLHYEDRRNCARKLAESVEDVLGLKRYTRTEFFVMLLGGGAYFS